MYCLEYTMFDNYGYQTEHAGIVCSDEQELSNAINELARQGYALKVVKIGK